MSRITIPLRTTTSQHLIGDFLVNGIEGVFLIDTGASNSCIGQDLVKKFKLTAQGDSLSMTGAGNEKLNAHASQKSELAYKGNSLFHLEFMLIDLNPINTALKEQEETPIDGILGADLLRPQKAVINYKTVCLSLTIRS